MLTMLPLSPQQLLTLIDGGGGVAPKQPATAGFWLNTGSTQAQAHVTTRAAATTATRSVAGRVEPTRGRRVGRTDKGSGGAVLS